MKKKFHYLLTIQRHLKACHTTLSIYIHNCLFIHCLVGHRSFECRKIIQWMYTSALGKEPYKYNTLTQPPTHTHTHTHTATHIRLPILCRSHSVGSHSTLKLTNMQYLDCSLPAAHHSLHGRKMVLWHCARSCNHFAEAQSHFVQKEESIFTKNHNGKKLSLRLNIISLLIYDGKNLRLAELLMPLLFKIMLTV